MTRHILPYPPSYATAVQAAGDGSDATGALISALASYPVSYFSPGIYGMNTMSTLPAGENVIVIGSGIGQTILDAGANAYGIHVTKSTAKTVTFRDISFTGGTSAQVSCTYTGIETVRFIDCEFSDFNVAVQLPGSANIEMSRCIFNGDADGTGIALQHLYGSNRIRLRDCTFRYCYQSAYITSTGAPPKLVDMTGCVFDGGWQYMKAITSNSGGTVTYTSSTVTDTAATFPAYASEQTVRALAVETVGSITSITAPNILTDSTANYTTANVGHGDIVRMTNGGPWAIVDQVLTATTLAVEEWLDPTSYQPITNPAVGTGYTIYSLVIGQVQSNTSTTLTVVDWRTWNGTAVTPSAGTLYEVAAMGNYQGAFVKADKSIITGNTFRRSYADQLNLTGDAVITSNRFIDGQDVGCTLGPQTCYGVIFTSNRIDHEGSAGLYASVTTNLIIADNNISGNGWMSPPSSNYGGITLGPNCNNVKIHDNTIDAQTQPRANYGISISGPTSNVDINDNNILNYPTYDIALLTSTVTNVRGRFANGTRTYLSGATAPLGQYGGTGAPAVAAAIGSTYTRTDGGAGSTLYVKETGTGSSGWTAK